MKRYVKEFANDRKKQWEAKTVAPQDIVEQRLHDIDLIVKWCEQGVITELEAVRYISVKYGEFRKEA